MQMTQAQIDAFLAEPRNAIVGTNTPAGMPHLSPVWFQYEEGRLYIIVLADTAKYRNLKRDPRVAVCVDAAHPDSRTVMLYGKAQLIEASDPLVEELRWKIIRHYYETEESARVYFQSTKQMVWSLVVVTPNKIISQDFTEG